MKLTSPLVAALFGVCCMPVHAYNPATPAKPQAAPAAKAPAASTKTTVNKPVAEPVAKPKAEAPKAAPAHESPAQSHGTAKPAAATRKIGKLDWHTDYVAAYEAARDSKKMLLIVFRDERQARTANNFEQSVLAQPTLQRSLSNVVGVVLPISTLQPVAAPAAKPAAAAEKTDGKAVAAKPAPAPRPARLIDHSSFEFMYGQPGIAMIDLTNKKSMHYGKIVSAHPFGDGNAESLQGMQTILNLPKATVTQRGLIYAVLMYAAPISTTGGQCNDVCCEAARLGSELMAQSGTVGHIDWGSRGNMVMSATGRGASEVAAMGGGGTLQQACVQCVQLWQGSPAHWGIMSSPQTLYGYDIVRSGNGWFGTGVFGN